MMTESAFTVEGKLNSFPFSVAFPPSGLYVECGASLDGHNQIYYYKEG